MCKGKDTAKRTTYERNGKESYLIGQVSVEDWRQWLKRVAILVSSGISHPLTHW